MVRAGISSSLIKKIKKNMACYQMSVNKSLTKGCNFVLGHNKRNAKVFSIGVEIALLMRTPSPKRQFYLGPDCFLA